MLTVAVVVLMPFQHACQRSQRQPEQANTITTVWIPGGPKGGMMPHMNVEVLDQGAAFVKFRTEDGQIIEQHGPYRIETSKQDY